MSTLCSGGYNIFKKIGWWGGCIMWGWGVRGGGWGGGYNVGLGRVCGWGYNMFKKIGGWGEGVIIERGGGGLGGVGLSSDNHLVDGPTDRPTDRQTDMSKAIYPLFFEGGA
ncbi:hypothetical protein DPMN_155359 [Dreissena polymorpha]|uniref:Uncharacterized protein n=1 Tax=Dreissena polymorpha TaxID=45954 RepID=A0A9D4FM39_DREPO|nr:hypothetical protein DPMN_155359 [Dreissena polymorpha]